MGFLSAVARTVLGFIAQLPMAITIATILYLANVVIII